MMNLVMQLQEGDLVDFYYQPFAQPVCGVLKESPTKQVWLLGSAVQFDRHETYGTPTLKFWEQSDVYYLTHEGDWFSYELLRFPKSYDEL